MKSIVCAKNVIHFLLTCDSCSPNSISICVISLVNLILETLSWDFLCLLNRINSWHVFPCACRSLTVLPFSFQFICNATEHICRVTQNLYNVYANFVLSIRETHTWEIVYIEQLKRTDIQTNNEQTKQSMVHGVYTKLDTCFMRDFDLQICVVVVFAIVTVDAFLSFFIRLNACHRYKT